MSPVYDPDDDVKNKVNKSDKMPTGKHDVTIAKVLVDKGGTPWKTKKGDRQILVIFENEEGQEASAFFPLEGKARFRLSELFHGIGENTASLAAKGFTDPTTLCVAKIADHWLKGKRLDIDVVLKSDGYHDVEIMLPGELAPAPAKAAATERRADLPYDDRIPF